MKVPPHPSNRSPRKKIRPSSPQHHAARSAPSSQESSTTPVGNRYRAHRTGCCGSCWCLHAGCEHRLMERSPQHRGNTHRAPHAHAVSNRANPPCRAATRSAPTESSCAPPSSAQTRTQSQSYLKKPKKTGSSELSVSDRVFVGGCG